MQFNDVLHIFDNARNLLGKFIGFIGTDWTFILILTVIAFIVSFVVTGTNIYNAMRMRMATALVWSASAFALTLIYSILTK